MLQLVKSPTIRVRHVMVYVRCACGYLNKSYGVVETIKSVVEITIPNSLWIGL